MQIVSSHNENNYTHLCFVRKRSPRDFFSILLDPLSPAANLNLGWAYFEARRFDASITQIKKTLELNPKFAYAHMQLAWNYAKKEMYAEAIVESDKALTLLAEADDQLLLGSLGWVYGLSGRAGQAMKLLDRLEVLSTRKWVDPCLVAHIHDGLGAKDSVFECFEQSL